jgi:transposase-like protein
MSGLTPTGQAERAAMLFAELRAYKDEGERRRIPEVIAEIHRDRLWLALNYETWDDACDALMGGWRVQIPREDRREIVAELRDEGLSTRAISEALGIARNTVKKDIREVGQSDPPDADSTPVTGLDGKTYTPKHATVTHIDPDEVPDDEVAEVTATLESYIDGSADVRAARIRADFAKWIVQIGRTSLFDPEELAAITSTTSAENFAHALDRLTRWQQAYQSARSVGSLRVIQGEAR